ncbi:MAG: T9SS type A sorting domain-containing protein [Crocinitomicaceae bacterium]|nr:T9SS type A sorting domain-containing protein [Crocinitomicaceae bacterium]
MLKRLLVLVCLLPMLGNAQICTIDFSQTAPGIYPDTMPVGTVNQFYDEDITFVMPLDTQGFDFTNFHILSIALPVGLSWECNNSSSNCDYDPQVNQYGCVNVYGTPLLAGQYTVDVTVIADLTVASGIPTSFSVYMEILPASVSTTNNGFGMIGANGCMPQTVDFANNNPGLLAYSWDFGNGNTSTAENPAPQIYTTPGDYEVNYQAWSNLDTLEVYTLTNVTITSMSNYGGGFPAFESPDPYFIIYENGAIYNQSGVYADTFLPVGWNTSILLDPAQSYTIEIWESDAGEIGFGADDFMGVAPLNLNGCNGCAVGTSVIDYAISYQQILPSPSVISVDTVYVSGFPAVPTVTWDSIPHTLTSNDLGDSYQWYFNGSPIAGATDTTHIVQNSGYYHLVAINANGCVSFSDTTLAIYCDTAFLPQITTNTAGNLIILNSGNSDIQWYVDGVALQDDTLDVCVPAVSGNYTVTLLDEFGCLSESDPTAVTVGLDQLVNLAWSIFPNPAGDLVNIRVDESTPVDELEVVDMLGRTVLRSDGFSGEQQLELSELKNGSYIVRLISQDQIFTKSLLIHKK